MKVARIAQLLGFTFIVYFVLFHAHAKAEDGPGPDLKAETSLSFFTERVRQFTLPNGLRIVLYPRGNAPVFAGVVSVRVGGSDELPGSTGISHLLEHMAFKGTNTVGTTDFSREKKLLEKVEQLAQSSDGGTSFTDAQRAEWQRLHQELSKLWKSEEFTHLYEIRGAYGMNATTSSELTQYFVNLPRDAFEFWLKMESDRLLIPVMRQFYEERNVVLEERRMNWEDRPGGKLYEQLLATAFLHHPYRNPVIGIRDDVRRLTATDVEQFRRRFYVPNNMVVGLVGDVDAERDRPLIEKYFGRIPAGPSPERSHIIEDPQQGERQFTLFAPSQPEVWIAYRKPTYPDPDDIALTVLFEILAGSSVSPLYTELVEEKRVATGVDYMEIPGTADPNLVVFSVTTKVPHSNREALAHFDRVLHEFKNKGPSRRDLATAKRGLSVNFLERLDENSAVALSLAEAELLHGGWREVFKWYSAMQAVSIEDIRRVAERYLVPSSRTIAFLENSEGRPVANQWKQQ